MTAMFAELFLPDGLVTVDNFYSSEKKRNSEAAELQKGSAYFRVTGQV